MIVPEQHTIVPYLLHIIVQRNIKEDVLVKLLFNSIYFGGNYMKWVPPPYDVLLFRH